MKEIWAESERSGGGTHHAVRSLVLGLRGVRHRAPLRAERFAKLYTQEPKNGRRARVSTGSGYGTGLAPRWGEVRARRITSPKVSDGFSFLRSGRRFCAKSM